jgi:hypothetical protein
MRKFLLSSIIIFFVSLSVNACDICGSGSGSGYTGILPDFYKCIAGVRYRYNYLRTHLGAGGNATYLTSNEKYHTMEIWGGWALSDKIRIMGTLPYSINKKINQGIARGKNGISDISLAAYYKLLDKATTVLNKKQLTQTLWIGSAIKLPTGEYNPEDKSSTNQNANLFQLGTASVDYSLAAMYDVRLQNTGLNVSATYKMNTSNKYHYRYGNKLNVSTQVYHRFTLGSLVIAPNTGLQFETAQQDTDNRFKVDLSGGKALLGTVGIEGSLGKIAIGANFQTALLQHLANGFVKAGSRTMLHVSFAL